MPPSESVAKESDKEEAEVVEEEEVQQELQDVLNIADGF